MNLKNLPEEEVLLLDAVVQMCGQYAGARLDNVATAILATYGFDVDPTFYHGSARFLEIQELVEKYESEIGDSVEREGTKTNPERLNLRSNQLLILLAGQCEENLHDPQYCGKDELDHMFMSAGEAACMQLNAYALLKITDRGGYWTDFGKQAVATALNDNFYPMSDFTFEGVI